MYTVIRYSEYYKKQWNEFLPSAKNSSFLFNRDFIEYHSARFVDHSLIILNNNQIVGMIPANIENNIIYSHQGLTYGGIIVNRESKIRTVLEIVYYTLKYLCDSGVQTFVFKSFPRIYNEIPSDETDWILTILQAKLFRRDTTLTIDKRYPIKYQDRRLRSIKKAAKLQPVIKLEGLIGFDFFWKNVLEPNLLKKHKLEPAHNCNEIKLLASKFEENIKLYTIYVSDKMMAGCTLFLNKTVAHAQYISATEEGQKNGCLDFLFDFLINDSCKKFNYFDFGNCNEKNGTIINHGLMDWKEGFGARAISHDFYEIKTENYPLLSKVIP